MPAYLITGRSGSGKSTIFRELQKEGYLSIDSDRVPGLCSWVDDQTGKPVQVDYSKPIDRVNTLWNWDEAILPGLLMRSEDIYLCGSADNDLHFRELFDVVFVLTLPAEIQRQRILSRVEHNYGKLPAMQEQILAEQAEFVERALQLGAIKLDATRAPAEIVEAILEHVHAR